MEVDRAFTDCAPTREGDAGDASAGEHWSENADPRPHGADDVVVGVALGLIACAQGERWLGVLFGLDDLAPEGVEEFLHIGDVGQVGHVAEDHGFGGQQSGGHEGQGGVLGAIDPGGSFEPSPAFDGECVHAGVLSVRCG